MRPTKLGLLCFVTFGLLLLGTGILSADYIFDHEIGYILDDRAFTETAPPVGPVRPVAEFEPASHVLIRYPLGIPLALVVHLSNTAQVVTLVSNTNNQNQASNAFTNAGVNMANVSFMIAPTDSYWTRDFGPWFIVDGLGQYSVVDFRYNRPRPNDDAVPSAFAPQYGFPYYGMALYQTGGNYMTDGINTAAQTQIAYSENSSLSHAQVNQKMLSYLGVSNHFVIDDPNNTYIDHIDCWGKFLAPDKVLIRSVPTSHSQYSEIEAVANFFATTNSAWGYPYRVYRVNTPQNQPYTNSLILNRKVFVPIMNNSYDAAALQSYRDALPGYEVIGVSGISSAPWESTDALHCRTHEIADKEALYIDHTPYHGAQDFANGIDINVNIKAHSNATLYSDSLFVCYKLNQGSWQQSNLIELVPGFYTTMITQYTPGDTIRYFIHAADQSGRSLDHPYPAALDPHIFVTEADTQAPEIYHTPYTSITNQDSPLTFSAIVNDNHSVQGVQLECKIDNGAVQTYSMAYYDNDTWSVGYNTAFEIGQNVFSYRIVASDNANPANTATYPSENQWINIPIVITANADDLIPQIHTSLMQISPNPFKSKGRSNLQIDYQAKANQAIQVRVFNLRGQLVKALNGVAQTDGKNRLNWDGSDRDGNPATPGVYIIQFTADKYVKSSKVVIGN